MGGGKGGEGHTAASVRTRLSLHEAGASGLGAEQRQELLEVWGGLYSMVYGNAVLWRPGGAHCSP